MGAGRLRKKSDCSAHGRSREVVLGAGYLSGKRLTPDSEIIKGLLELKISLVNTSTVIGDHEFAVNYHMTLENTLHLKALFLSSNFIKTNHLRCHRLSFKNYRHDSSSMKAVYCYYFGLKPNDFKLEGRPLEESNAQNLKDCYYLDWTTSSGSSSGFHFNHSSSYYLQA